ncbi:MAG: hypothetical protein EXR05_05495 [Acetobacteraceae bacterium]|nr:hypothetical protein [Acetobacteraceae bacterium]MSP31060.1 hypothetical protein [Acetobacteraceae bacterium]
MRPDITAGSVLENMPTGSSGQACIDLNKDGKIDPVKERSALHERLLPWPSDLARRADIPLKWVPLNWNPKGHILPGIYDTSHFEVHFMIDPIESILSIHPGGCGPEHLRCDQFAAARKPTPGNYTLASYIDVGAVVPGMGNHLVNVTGPEFKGKKFKCRWIYGVYGGRVTFYEDMVDLAYLKSKPSEYFPIPELEAVAASGYYQTQSCICYVEGNNNYMVFPEGFAMRTAARRPRRARHRRHRHRRSRRVARC